MEFSRYLQCLAADFARARTVLGAAEPKAPVPSCPGWTVADLTQHLGAVYLHKARCIQLGAEPEPWPPAGLDAEDPLALLDRAYAELGAEFSQHAPEDPSGGWYEPDKTVGFLMRRMAQETVIHRVDAELGAGEPVAAIPDDLAVDGVDELLKLFTAYGVAEWPDYFGEALNGSPGRSLGIRAGTSGWRVEMGPGRFIVADADATTEAGADATVSGPPAAVLRWLWHREAPGEATGVSVAGDPAAVDELRRCLTIATQ
jgi:uncharacterized protein (TIGR03083 family)